MTHTVESLLKLADAQATERQHAHFHPELEARAALQSALTEVLAELQQEQADNVAMSMLADEYKAERDTLQSKCDEQAAEIERLNRTTCACRFDNGENTEQCKLHGAWCDTLHEQADYRRERDQLRAKVAAVQQWADKWAGVGYEDSWKNAGKEIKQLLRSVDVAKQVETLLAPGAAPKEWTEERKQAAAKSLVDALAEHNAQAAPAQWMKDVLATGVAVTVGGVPVDPSSIYKEAAPAAQPLTDDYLESLRDKEFRFSHAIGKEQQ